MLDRQEQKKLEQAHYRAQIAEAELNAVKSSKAYKASKSIGVIKAQITKDPIGLSKKIAKKLLHEPSKARHLLRSANRGAFIASSVQAQTARYQEWILLNEPDEAELDEQRRHSGSFKKQPLISIVTPVFNPPTDVLEELIESVLEQTYPHFELCLGDFGDSQPVRDLLTKYAKLDDRIKYFVFKENVGIAGNSNQILEKVSGDYIALLDHDDTLSPDALYENVLLLNDKPYDFIYSDKDKIDEAGNRFEPLFKPQLSPEMLLNINYLTHLNVMRTSIVKDIGGWDGETDGAQDWDLFLRVIAASKLVGHVPKVLYHWRVIATSTAMSIETKPYALAGQRRAVDKYMKLVGIPATSYHEKTELFLRWERDKLDQRPLICLYFSSLTNMNRTMRAVKKVVSSPEFLIMVKDDQSMADSLSKNPDLHVLSYDEAGFAQSFAQFVSNLTAAKKERTVMVLRDDIRFPKNHGWYENLAGWLAITEVAASGGRLVDRHDLIVRSAGVISPEHRYLPLFYKFPRFYQSYLGNAEWVRNVSIIPSDFFATKLSKLQDYAKNSRTDDTAVTFFDRFFISLPKTERIVMTPHATASIFEDAIGDPERQLPIADKTALTDKFSNRNVSPADPMRLFEHEQLSGVDEAVISTEPADRYQHDAIILANTFDVSASELAYNAKILAAPVTHKAASVAIVLPSFDALYAGLMNIFTFVDFLATTKAMRTTVYILKDKADASSERDLVLKSFPTMNKAQFKGILPSQVDAITAHDIGIATQWATAYPLVKSRSVLRKYYFIQDNEANFYPKGTVSALVDMTYRFGFTALAGTDGLLDMYQKQYGGSGIVLKSKVDLTAYSPRSEQHYTPKKPYKVFFYARPNMPRNAFELGIAGLRTLKEDLGANVEIITAGAPWNPADYGVDGLFTNLNKIAYEAVPKLYRSVDAGLMFMFSGHPGVTASELMASGCPVVVNEYDDQTWHELYQHEKTCLITAATASEVARNLKRCLLEPELRKTLIDGGLKKATAFYTGYEDSLEETYRQLTKLA